MEMYVTNSTTITKHLCILRIAVTFLVLLSIACGPDRTALGSHDNRNTLQATARIVSNDSVFYTRKIKDDGSFAVEQPGTPPGFYTIELFEEGNSRKHEFLVYLDDSPLKILFNPVHPAQYPEIFDQKLYQDEIQKYYSKLNPMLQVVDLELESVRKAIRDEMQRTGNGEKLVRLNERLKMAEMRKSSVMKDVKRNYILNNPSSLLSAYLLSQSKDEVNSNAALYNDLYSNLSEEMKNSIYGAESRSLIRAAQAQSAPSR